MKWNEIHQKKITIWLADSNFINNSNIYTINRRNHDQTVIGLRKQLIKSLPAVDIILDCDCTDLFLFLYKKNFIKQNLCDRQLNDHLSHAQKSSKNVSRPIANLIDHSTSHFRANECRLKFNIFGNDDFLIFNTIREKRDFFCSELWSIWHGNHSKYKYISSFMW